MGLFSRKGRHRATDNDDDDARAIDDGVDIDGVDLDDADADAEVDAEADHAEPVVDRSTGPYDVSEVDDDGSRLDLGAIRVFGVPGMAVRLDVDEATQAIVSATLTHGSSSVQLQAYAAPRTAGIWPDIRADLASSLEKAGGSADIVDGPLGREIIGRMPSRAADGRTVFAPARFIGVDGPRWFLRAVISGQAASDPSTSEAIIDLVRSVVVVRGSEAMAPREALPLRVPHEARHGSHSGDAADPSDSPDPEASSDPASPADGTDGPHAAEQVRDAARRDDLRPFDRGPEITEVR